MRVSGIENYLGGADNVAAKSIIQGEQIIYRGVIHDGTAEQTPIDITNFVFSASVEYYTATVTASGRTATVTGFEANSKDDADLTAPAAVSDEVGVFSLTIPADLATSEETGAIDSTSVLTAVIYITYADGDTSATTTTIRKSRLLVFIRHAA